MMKVLLWMNTACTSRVSTGAFVFKSKTISPGYAMAIMVTWH